MKPWLKGGLIGVLVLLLLLLIPKLFAFSEGFSLLYFIIFFFGENPFDLFGIIGFAVIYFLIGAAIGLGIDKFKSRNKIQ